MVDKSEWSNWTLSSYLFKAKFKVVFYKKKMRKFIGIPNKIDIIFDSWVNYLHLPLTRRISNNFKHMCKNTLAVFKPTCTLPKKYSWDYAYNLVKR